MATYIKILNNNDIASFENPPQLSGEDRKCFFYFPKWVEDLIENFRTPTNQVGFILQFGYFKATGRFFVTRKFHQNDVEFIANRLDIQLDELDLENYTTGSFLRHQEIILDNMGVRKFNRALHKLLVREAGDLASKQMKPRFIFLSLMEFLKNQRIEIPNYHAFEEIVTDALRTFEKSLIKKVQKRLSTSDKQLLDQLLEIGDEYTDGDKQESKIKRYKLTLLKKTNQSTQPSKIKENIKDLQCLEGLFEKTNPVISTLDLSAELIQYYAQVVIKSQIFQTSRREEERKYLLLMSFVAYQYYQLNDVLIEILMQSVQSTLNTTEREHKDFFYRQRKERSKKFNAFSQNISNHLGTVEQARVILEDQILSSDSKIEKLQMLFFEKINGASVEIQDQISQLDKESSRITKNTDYYDHLESKSVKLQNRASDIVKNIHFDAQTSNEPLIQAIEYYKQKDGNLDDKAPIDFLDAKEQKILSDSNGKFRVSLYKVLLFSKVADNIRSGALNLKFSYKYRTFDDYLIPQEVWENNKDELLKRAGLTKLQDFMVLEEQFKKALQEQYRETNENIISGKNSYATIKENGDLKLRTPKKNLGIFNTDLDLFPKNRFISLFEIFSTVEQASQFTDCFEHLQVKHNREKPADRTFFAGMIGYGCNLGIRKTAKISRNIDQAKLENTIRWYFSHENIIRANDKVLSFLDQLQLPKIFKRSQDKTHTSSDGQKFGIGVDSLNAGYSYKYFGQHQGVSVYSFIDESHRLYYSTVINPAEREAAYVIDGLMHNDVVQSDIHSTDTHGYSELIFGVTHLLGISFAPRIKNFKKQHLYSFEKLSALKNLGYHILPKKTVDLKHISDQWDQILRFIATIKLKETSASQLFKRLSSYSKQHPLYRAMKQFGRIIKTLFLLKYIDDVELRQMIEKQLNKLESSNKFGKAVFHGNNQEFQLSTKEEQLIADGCKRLIENVIICWNYLYLSKLISNAESGDQKSNLINMIKNGSVVVWRHINLQGEYDFSDEKLKDSIEFSLPELLDLQVA